MGSVVWGGVFSLWWRAWSRKCVYHNDSRSDSFYPRGEGKGWGDEIAFRRKKRVGECRQSTGVPKRRGSPRCQDQTWEKVHLIREGPCSAGHTSSALEEGPGLQPGGCPLQLSPELRASTLLCTHSLGGSLTVGSRSWWIEILPFCPAPSAPERHVAGVSVGRCAGRPPWGGVLLGRGGRRVGCPPSFQA